MHRSDVALVRFLALASVLAVLIGCQEGPAFKTVPVSVKVTYEDGSAIPGDYITVSFEPQAAPADSQNRPRPGAGKISGGSGEVEGITTYEQGDGLVLGKHKVSLLAPTADPTRSPIPKAYTERSTTPLEIEVTEANQKFELKIPKP